MNPNPVINNSPFRKGSFKGNPNGFVDLPVGSLFRRIHYRYEVMVQGQKWKTYEQFYYEPNPREFEKDDTETLWYKSTPKGNRDGWVILPKREKEKEEFYYITINGSDYLLVGNNELLTYK